MRWGHLVLRISIGSDCFHSCIVILSLIQIELQFSTQNINNIKHWSIQARWKEKIILKLRTSGFVAYSLVKWTYTIIVNRCPEEAGLGSYLAL